MKIIFPKVTIEVSSDQLNILKSELFKLEIGDAKDHSNIEMNLPNFLPETFHDLYFILSNQESNIKGECTLSRYGNVIQLANYIQVFDMVKILDLYSLKCKEMIPNDVLLNYSTMYTLIESRTYLSMNHTTKSINDLHTNIMHKSNDINKVIDQMLNMFGLILNKHINIEQTKRNDLLNYFRYVYSNLENLENTPNNRPIEIYSIWNFDLTIYRRYSTVNMSSSDVYNDKTQKYYNSYPDERNMSIDNSVAFIFTKDCISILATRYDRTNPISYRWDIHTSIEGL